MPLARFFATKRFAAVSAAGYDDPVYHVGPQGWTKLSMDDVGPLHYHYEAQRR